MAKVTLQNIYKVYEGGVRAVNDFSLDIPDKEFVVFVGPSGCGKSTTLRMIAGLEDITAGKLLIDDEVVNDVESKNRDIAMVFQSYALYPHMTVYQNMAFGLKLRKTPKEIIDSKVKAAAEILEISELLSRKPKALSGGQRQRVALGRAIVREPKVFLLDEPLSNLDAKLRVQMRSEITKLHQKLKTTFIYVTHDQTEAMTMGTRIVVMKDGFIQQVDSPVALFEDPANLFVATFLGSPQMNILQAKLQLDGTTLKAKLLNSEENCSVVFPEIKKNEISSIRYFDKEVILGIRPESIFIDENGPIKAVIEVVEQLGDETILYCNIPGIKENLVVKTPFKGHVDTNIEVKLNFEMNQIHLFDKETTKSILGIRSDNEFTCLIKDGFINIGKNKFEIPSYLSQRLLPEAYNKDVILSVPVDKLSFEKEENALQIPIKFAFKEQKTDYIAVYFNIEGLDNYYVLKLKNGETKMPEFVSLKFEDIKFVNSNGDAIISKEIIYPNSCEGALSIKGNVTYLKAFGTTLQIPTKPEYKNGNCKVTLDIYGGKALFNKKLNKNNPKHNEEIVDRKNVISFDALDEYHIGSRNIVYGLVNKTSPYATFVIPNDFSVYKMPRFSICLDENAIKVEQ